MRRTVGIVFGPGKRRRRALKVVSDSITFLVAVCDSVTGGSFSGLDKNELISIRCTVANIWTEKLCEMAPTVCNCLWTQILQ